MKILNFPKIFDPRGNLTFLQYPDQIPFEIKRVFWTYDVSGGESRGGHAYKTQEEIIIALSGSFDIVITSKEGVKETITLNRSYYGLYIPPYTWRNIENFSTNAVSVHVCSAAFEESDYIREFEEFKKSNS